VPKHPFDSLQIIHGATLGEGRSDQAVDELFGLQTKLILVANHWVFPRKKGEACLRWRLSLVDSISPD
jgi:hypothetical protein